MNAIQLAPEEIAVLSALATGIIPADGRDAGAEGVDAGRCIANRASSGWNAHLYRAGLKAAASFAAEKYHGPVNELSAGEIHSLLGELAESSPAFFRQLRADVCAIYLSDPNVWQRIGFPGPSTSTGGYPDFDQPQ